MVAAIVSMVCPCLRYSIPGSSSTPVSPATTDIAAAILNQQISVTRDRTGLIHWSTYVTGFGVLTALVMVLSGLAASALYLTVLGSFSLISSSIGCYYTYTNRYLRNLQEFDVAFKTLNRQLEQKNEEIQGLVSRVEALNHSFSEQQIKYTQALKENNDVEERLNKELALAQKRLQETTDQFSKSQALAAADFAQKAALYENAGQKMRIQIQAELDQIAVITHAAEVAKEEVVQLHQQQQALSLQLNQYKQSNADYGAQNDRLAQQIMELKKIIAIPNIDPATAKNHADDVKRLIAVHVENTNQLAQATTQFNEMLDQIDAINQRLTSFKPKTVLKAKGNP